MRTLTAFAVSCMAIASASAAELPFRVLLPSEVTSLVQGGVVQPGVTATYLNQTNVNTAASVTVHKLNGAAFGSSSTSTDRKYQALAQVYKGAISAGPTPNAGVAPPVVVDYASGLLNYEINPNSAQAWATMSELGVPYVYAVVNGQSKSQSAASWSTQYTVPGSGTRDVYAQFTIPSVEFYGRWEDGRPSLYWARARIDFLVDGYPAWSTEAIRFNEMDAASKQKAVRLDTFGYNIAFNAANPDTPTPSRLITLYLGTYSAGKVLDLTQLFQAEGKIDRTCLREEEPDDDEMPGDKPPEGEDYPSNYCGGASAKIDWDPAAPQPTFYSKSVP